MRTDTSLASVKGELEQLLTNLGYELILMRYFGRARRGHLEVLIDKPGGVNIADCETVSQQVSAYLDVLDPIPHTYTLEVSSPGVNRPLTKDAHLEANVGQRVILRLNPGDDGRSRRIEGILKGVGREALEMEIRGQLQSIPRETIRESRLVYDWDREPERRKQTNGSRQPAEGKADAGNEPGGKDSRSKAHKSKER